jgi:hypothetical protein
VHGIGEKKKEEVQNIEAGIKGRKTTIGRPELYGLV